MTPSYLAPLAGRGRIASKMQSGCCLFYTSPSPRERTKYLMPSFALKKKKNKITHTTNKKTQTHKKTKQIKT
ncbi:hypothetical protein, partial [Bradyrhizobium japonicum]|uniref:hypothetical protein n=1 Tax=Bradyrhizobium japonicum TaxID=375 RepID=UPI001AEF8FBB